MTDETPQRAAERIWRETEHNPVETMKRFDGWARQKPERMLAVLGRYWERHVRSFLEVNQTNGGDRAWRHADVFRAKLRRWEMKAEANTQNDRNKRRRCKLDADEKVVVRAIHRERCRTYEARKAAGIKIIRAEVDAKTGTLINLIDKEFGPFAHIRINGLRLPEATTEQALAHCDRATTDVRFIRALCHLIPDPRRPIGEQWTAEIIREAKRTADRVAA